MTIDVALTAIMLLVASSLLLLMTALAVVRLVRNASERMAGERLRAVRPMLLRQLSESPPNLSKLAGESRSEHRQLTQLVWCLLTKVRGEAKIALIDWLILQGEVRRECRNITSRRRLVRVRAVKRLGDAEVRSVARAIESQLCDRDQYVRIVAARSLGQIGDPASVRPLLHALSGQPCLPHNVIVMSLIHMGPQIAHELITLLQHEDARVRSVCAELLGLHGTAKALQKLAFLAERDTSTKSRVSAIGALGRIGAPECLPALQRIAFASDVKTCRFAAIRSIGLIGGPHARESLTALANNDDAEIAKLAIVALTTMGEQGLDVAREIARSSSELAAVARDQLERTALSRRTFRRRTETEMALTP